MEHILDIVELPLKIIISVMMVGGLLYVLIGSYRDGLWKKYK